jgi:hypothetical protein
MSRPCRRARPAIWPAVSVPPLLLRSAAFGSRARPGAFVKPLQAGRRRPDQSPRGASPRLRGGPRGRGPRPRPAPASLRSLREFEKGPGLRVGQPRRAGALRSPPQGRAATRSGEATRSVNCRLGASGTASEPELGGSAPEDAPEAGAAEGAAEQLVLRPALDPLWVTRSHRLDVAEKTR